jgi:uncharacterized protein involved in type VI secretion and phage assembly
MGEKLHAATGLVSSSDTSGRARIRFPWLDSNTVANARVCKHVGPLTADTEVVVIFLYGDPNHPVVVGRF